MANKKNDMLGAGVAGILGKNAAMPRPAQEKTDDGYFSYRKGRPRKDDPHTAAFNDGKTFEATSLWLEKEQYRKVRDLAQERRVTIKEMMYILLDAGLKKIDKNVAAR